MTKVWIEWFDQKRTLTPTAAKVDGLVVHQCNHGDLWVFYTKVDTDFGDDDLLVPVQDGKALYAAGEHYWPNPDNDPQ